MSLFSMVALPGLRLYRRRHTAVRYNQQGFGLVSGAMDNREPAISTQAHSHCGLLVTRCSQTIREHRPRARVVDDRSQDNRQ